MPGPRQQRRHQFRASAHLRTQAETAGSPGESGTAFSPRHACPADARSAGSPMCVPAGCYVPLVNLTARLIVEQPTPIWFIECENSFKVVDNPVADLLGDLAVRLVIDSRPAEGRHWVTFRGVPIERLRAVLENGVDVSPTDTTIFCADIEKAFEYGRPAWGQAGAGLVYALRGSCLERSFRVLPADASPGEIAEVQRTYPHRYDDPHGQLRFTRLTDQVNPAYEDAYGYWVPGNARDALLAVVLFGQNSEAVKAVSGVLDLLVVDGAVPTGERGT